MPEGRRRARIILVIEDEADAAAVLATTLTEAGFVVVTAHAGRERLALVEDVRPDLVLLDFRLPDVSGFRLLPVCQHDAATRHLPVLVLTALTFAEAERAAWYGAEAVLTKPSVLSDLLAHAEELLGRAGATGVRTVPQP
jgi:two-component system phosphate regulon response regulator PhoB